MRPVRHSTHTVTIDNLGSRGEGVGRLDGFTLFVDGALPGEKVSVKITEVKKTYGRGKLIKVIEASPERDDPICPLFGRCGGCQIMHLKYTGQLKIKRQRVVDAFERVGGFTEADIAACHPSPTPLEYRNKIQLPTTQEKGSLDLGLYMRNSHDVIPVEHCYIHCTLGEEVFQHVRKILQKSGITPFDEKTGEGTLRHVLIRTAIHAKEVLVTLVTKEAKVPKLQAIAEEIMQCCPEVAGVIQNINKRSDNVIVGNQFVPLSGRSHLLETLQGLTFKIDAPSFFQVNTLQAESLYAKALELAELSPNTTLLDAYCGVGTLALLAASRSKEVLGIECVPEAIENAKNNAERNGITNATFTCGETEKLIHTLPPFDRAILNPPRKGCDPRVLASLTKGRPDCIVYVSCDPATLARDARVLVDAGYQLGTVYPFDMFPQTSHVESVVSFKTA